MYHLLSKLSGPALRHSWQRAPKSLRPLANPSLEVFQAKAQVAIHEPNRKPESEHGVSLSWCCFTPCKLETRHLGVLRFVLCQRLMHICCHLHADVTLFMLESSSSIGGLEQNRTTPWPKEFCPVELHAAVSRSNGRRRTEGT